MPASAGGSTGQDGGGSSGIAGSSGFPNGGTSPSGGAAGQGGTEPTGGSAGQGSDACTPTCNGKCGSMVDDGCGDQISCPCNVGQSCDTTQHVCVASVHAACGGTCNPVTEFSLIDKDNACACAPKAFCAPWKYFDSVISGGICSSGSHVGVITQPCSGTARTICVKD